MEEIRVITEAEWKILQQLWKQEPMTIMQLTRAFEAETGWTKHTIISFLNRMEEKDLLFYEESGRARQYYSLIDYQTALTQEVQILMRKTGSSLPGLLQDILKNADLDDADRKMIQSALTGRKKQ